jgi:lipoprotein-anchoring transpeptidase ErfK/SrfK
VLGGAGRQFFEMVAGKIAFVVGAGLLTLPSCGVVQEAGAPQSSLQEAEQKPRFEVFEEVYRTMERGKGSIGISLAEQRLILRDGSGRVAIETDCSTGIEGRETPTGTFRLKKMRIDKRSNLYGKYVSKETGEVVVAKSWEVDGAPAGTKYLGTAMPYWMRVTWDGVGIHVGEFPKGYRSSFGCIRMPEKIQPQIYEKCRSGMRVTIRE